MTFITLLGDSIFDNKVYVGRKKDTIERLRDELEHGENAVLLAVDGSVVTDVHRQIKDIPAETTHLVLSVGGNDALAEADILDAPVDSSGAVFDELSVIGKEFETRYRTLIQKLISLEIPLTVCTIYHPVFTDKAMQRRAVAALSTFNDVIISTAIDYGLPIIDLRKVCRTFEDYANPIEPSSEGSRKIAVAICKMVDGMSGQSLVYV
jgi:lysophospholipase L1-like esterase